MKQAMMEQTQYSGTYKVWDTYTGECVAIVTSYRTAELLARELSDIADEHQITNGNVTFCPDCEEE